MYTKLIPMVFGALLLTVGSGQAQAPAGETGTAMATGQGGPGRARMMERLQAEGDDITIELMARSEAAREKAREAMQAGDPAKCHNPPDLGAAAVTMVILGARSYREGRAFHTETACAISTAFGQGIRLSEWEAFAAETPEKAYKLRFVGKKTNHATAYKMGPIKGAEEVNKEADDTGVTCTSAQFKDAQRLWVRKYIRMPAWWKEIEGYSHRDQLSFNYACWKTGVEYSTYPVSIRSDKRIEIMSHVSESMRMSLRWRTS